MKSKKYSRQVQTSYRVAPSKWVPIISLASGPQWVIIRLWLLPSFYLRNKVTKSLNLEEFICPCDGGTANPAEIHHRSLVGYVLLSL